MKRINQFEPWFDNSEKKFLNDVIDSGWIQESKLTREFERKFAEFVGSRYAVATTSGTAALFLALKAKGVGFGDRVIIPDYTAIGTANAVSLTGAMVDVVDVVKHDANIDPSKIKKAIKKNTKAVVAVHVNGRPANIKQIKEVISKNGINVIEDAAQCLGSRINHKHLGTLSEIGCFSLATSKIITTGQGGMVVTSSKKLFHKLVELKDQGTTARLKSSSIPDWYPKIGFNFKFSDLQSAVGLAQFKKLEYRIKRRVEMWKLYRELLENKISFLATEIDKGVLPWYVDVIAKSQNQRNKILSNLRDSKIMARKFYRPIHHQPSYKRTGEFTNTEKLAKTGMWLPSSTFLTNQEIENISKKILLS